MYRNKRWFVKKLIRKEKKEMRKRVLEKIKEQGGPSCKLFWADLKLGCQSKKRSIPKVRSNSGATVDEPTEALEELAKLREELEKQQSNYGQRFARRDRGEDNNLELCEEVTWQQELDILKYL